MDAALLGGPSAALAPAAGAFCFGAVVGWFLYYVNRHRSGDVSLADVATLVGAIGGAAVLALFPVGTTLFGWYGIGLLAGFLAYFVVLVVVVLRSREDGWSLAFLLDGRTPALRDGQTRGGQRPMGDDRPDVRE